jgi:hypothetical protein
MNPGVQAIAIAQVHKERKFEGRVVRGSASNPDHLERVIAQARRHSCWHATARVRDLLQQVDSRDRQVGVMDDPIEQCAPGHGPSSFWLLHIALTTPSIAASASFPGRCDRRPFTLRQVSLPLHPDKVALIVRRVCFQWLTIHFG